MSRLLIQTRFCAAHSVLDISWDVFLVEGIGVAGEKTQGSFNDRLFFQKEEKNGTTGNDVQRDAPNAAKLEVKMINEGRCCELGALWISLPVVRGFPDQRLGL